MLKGDHGRFSEVGSSVFPSCVGSINPNPISVPFFCYITISIWVYSKATDSSYVTKFLQHRRILCRYARIIEAFLYGYVIIHFLTFIDNSVINILIYTCLLGCMFMMSLNPGEGLFHFISLILFLKLSVSHLPII